MYLFTEDQLNSLATKLNYTLEGENFPVVGLLELRNPKTEMSQFLIAVEDEDGNTKYKLDSYCFSLNDNLVRRIVERIEYTEQSAEAISFGWASSLEEPRNEEETVKDFVKNSKWTFEGKLDAISYTGTRDRVLAKYSKNATKGDVFTVVHSVRENTLSDFSSGDKPFTLPVWLIKALFIDLLENGEISSKELLECSGKVLDAIIEGVDASIYGHEYRDEIVESIRNEFND